MAAAEPYVVWKDEFSVGDERLAAQHRRMFDLLNAMYGVGQEGGPRGRLAKMFEEVRRYAEDHFATEEAAMERFGYARLREHKAAHET